MIVMKMKLILVCALFITSSSIFAQSINTLVRLHRISEGVGIVNSVVNDTAIIAKRKIKQKRKYEEQQLCLLRATEYFSTEDYESSLFYIKRVKKLKSIDMINIKYVVLVCSYARMEDLYNASKFYIEAVNKVDPVNLRLIKKTVGECFTKVVFEKAMRKIVGRSYAKKLIEEIHFSKEFVVEQ